METNNTFSLSMQKQISQNPISFDCELNRAFNELHFRTLLNRSGIIKQKGYAAVSILFLIVLLPLLKRTLNEFGSTSYIAKPIKAQKDVYYRFLNHERFNWRRLVYFVALKVINFCGDVPLSEKALIAGACKRWRSNPIHQEATWNQ